MAVPASASAPSQPASSGAVRVMVVDDSAVIRGQLVRALEADPAIEVVASVVNGDVALKTLGRQQVDVVVLDIEMPVMDGMTALPLMVAKDPNLKVIMASTLTMSNAKISMEALAKGASDYIAKPTSTGAMISADDFKHELVAKIKALAGRRRSPVAMTRPKGQEPVRSTSSLYDAPVTLRSPGKGRPQVLAVGSSTGGPQALLKLFGLLKGQIKVPVLITQHMPANFTTILAEHLHRASGLPCAEGEDGEPLADGRMYVAPGDYHMTVERDGVQSVIRLNQGPRESFCRPAVDPMLRSMAQVFGGGVLTVILTGMGHDGREGARDVVQAGGTIFAQDEATSVVWGMPGAVATAGLCSTVDEIDKLAPHIVKALGNGTS